MDMRLIVILSIWAALGCSVSQRSLEDQREALRLIDVGAAELARGRLNQAEAAFQVAHELSGLAAAYDGLGCVAFKRGELTLAEQIFRQVVAGDPTYVTARVNLALTLEKLNRPAEAAKLYSQALDMDPKEFRARNNLAGLVFEQGGEPNFIRAQLHRAANLSSDPIMNHNLKILGDPDE